MTIFENEIVNIKAFEHANLIFTEPWILTVEIMLNIMQNFKFDFLKNEYQANWVYVLSSISRTLHNISTGFFPMYRGILELKKVTITMHKNGSFSKGTCWGLTALFLKTKIYICRFKFVKKQINKIASITFSFRL